MDGVVAYILGKSYVKKSLIGIGALAGAPCQVQSINKVGKTTTVTLKWEDNVGGVHTQAFDIEDGLDGVSVVGATINSTGNLILTLSDTNTIDCGKVLPQYDTMPVASATNEGQILQYIGATNVNYIKGYYYECINDGGVYKWVNIKVQDSEDIFRYNTLPTPNSSINGAIIQYIGATNVNYINGYYYQCVESPVGSGTYVWVQKNVQPSGGSTGGDGVVDGYYNSNDQMFYYDNLFTNPIIGEDNTIYVDLENDLLYRYNGLIFIRVDETDSENDVINGYYNTTDHKFYEESTYTTEIIGETGKIYISDDTNIQYRWDGTQFVTISSSIEVDSALSTTSENPVQNKVISLTIDQLQGSVLNKIQKKLSVQEDNFVVFTNDGDIADSGISKDVIPNTVSISNKLLVASDLSSKANKVIGATNGDLAGLNGDGDLIDSGKKLSDLQEKLTKGDGIDITGTTISVDIPYLTASRVGYISSSEKGSNNGVAELDNAGKIPSSQLPSYVDDVIEGYLDSGAFYEDAAHTILITPESGKIYVDLTTNTTYRWSGTAYVQISESLALGTTHATAYYGDLGKIAYDHSQITNGTNPHNTTADNINLKVPITTLSGSKLDVESTLHGINDKAYLIDDAAETTIDDADYFPFYNSINGKKKSLWSNIKEKLKTYFDTIYQSILTFDDIPTENSDNPVKSGGIYNALAPKVDETLLKDTVGWTGKNRLHISDNIVNKTNVNGVDFAVNRNIEGEVVNIGKTGTCNSASSMFFVLGTTSTGEYLDIPDGDYIVSGCPNGGSSSTYRLRLYDRTSETTVGYEYGSGLTFTHDHTHQYALAIVIYPSATQDLTFYPMIRSVSIIDDTYEPYHDSVKEEFDSILEEVSDNEPYVLRQSLGNMVETELIGGSVAWNQLVQNGNFVNTDNWLATNSRGTLSASNNVLTYTLVTIGTSATQNNIRQNLQLISGHKYFIRCDANTNVNTTFSFLMLDESIQNANYQKAISTGWNTVKTIMTPSGNCDNIRLCFDMREGFAVGDEVKYRNANLVDLTQMFGSTIADALYTLETTTEGAGVEWFDKYFPKIYYDYDTGSIQSVDVFSKKVVGKNKIDIKQVTNPNVPYNSINSYIINDVFYLFGTVTDSAGYYFGSSGRNMYLPAGKYTLTIFPEGDFGSDTEVRLRKSSDASKIVSVYTNGQKSTTFTLNEGINVFIGIVNTTAAVGTYVNANLRIQIELGTISTDYEPYREIVYGFDGSKQLLGVPKLVDNKLQYDGDIYNADGQIIRKYGIVELSSPSYSRYEGSVSNYFQTTLSDGAVEMQGITQKYTFVGRGTSTLTQDKTWANSNSAGRIYIRDDDYSDATTFKDAMSGIYLVYELANPTTESANYYQNPQRTFSDGTEEFVDGLTRDVTIPVGHNSIYQKNVTLPPIENYTDIQVNDVYKANGVTGAKNLNKTTYTIPSNTYGITFTVNSDGTITANGTNDGTENSLIGAKSNEKFTFNQPSGNYIVSGGINDGVYVYLIDRTTNINLTGSFIGEKVVSMIQGHEYSLVCRINKTRTVNNVTFKPMIRVASDIDSTYQPPCMTNSELMNILKRTDDDPTMLTAGTNITIDNCVKCISGKLCTYQIRFTTNDAIAAGDIILTDFPDLPMFTYALAESATFLGRSDHTKYLMYFAVSNGIMSLKCDDAIPSGAQVSGIISYILK